MHRAALLPLVVVSLVVAIAVPAHAAKQPGPKQRNKSSIDHIVVVTMENRSFDHLLGWHPTANGEQAGLAYPDETGASIATAPLAPDYTGCGHPDPDHSWAGSRVSYADGAMNGFLLLLLAPFQSARTAAARRPRRRPCFAVLSRRFS